MKRSALGIFLVLPFVTITGQTGNATRSADVQVKKLAERYAQVESQLERSVHYLKSEGSGAETSIEQAWFDGAGDLIKVATEKTDAAGRELTEYFALHFENKWDGMFLLTRKETALPDGGMQVDEARRYFGEGHGNGVLLRELKKSARFQAGESTDTARVPNVAVPAKKADRVGEEDLAKAQREMLEAPEKIAAAVRAAGPPVTDPFASVKGDSEKFRVIHGTVSPDGRYAIALGFARDKIDWESFADSRYDTGDKTYFTEDEESVRNYLVELSSQRILGETGGAHFGTRKRYNHRECMVSWPADSATFVQGLANKWSSEGCYAGRIGAGPMLLGTLDLGSAAAEKAEIALKKRHHEERDAGLTFDVSGVANEGVVDLQVYSIDAVVPHRGETLFAFKEKMRLRETPTGLRAELVSIRKVQEPD